MRFTWASGWLVFCCLVAAGCGGGSAGTSSTGGDFRVRVIDGSVTDPSGAAIAGVQVGVAESDGTAVTDAAGRFNLSAETGESFTLLLQDAQSSASVDVAGVDASNSVVTVDAILDRSSPIASAVTASGAIEVRQSCRSEIDRNAALLTIPRGAAACSIEYRISSNAEIISPTLTVATASGCERVRFAATGGQGSGNRVSLFQEITASNFSGECRATITAPFSGIRTAPSFVLRLQAEGNGAATPAPGPAAPVKSSYRGSLKLASNSGGTSQCSRFLKKSTNLVFSVNGSTISAELPDEGLSLRAPVGTQSDPALRYQVEQSLSGTTGQREEISIAPLGGFGDPRANFVIQYRGIATSNGAVECERFYFGIIS